MDNVKFNHTQQTGFSLIELMVGLVIGLLATLVIVQTFSAFEGQKRSTTGSADAQTNNSIAMMYIQRNLQSAGYGLALPNANPQASSLKCNKFANYTHPVNGNTTNLFPVEIVDGGGSNGSDSLTVRYSRTAVGAVPVTVKATSPSTQLDNNIGCNVGDIALVSNGSDCAFTTVTTVPASSKTQLSVSGTPSQLVVNATLACMGDWQDYTFTVSGNELQMNGESIVTEIVSLQAQYGVAATADSNVVATWEDATGSDWAASTMTVANRNRIKAVRVAIVARNGLLEKTEVTPNAITTTLGAVDLTADTNWKRYRYRVLETTVPLRNMLWSKGAV